MNDMILGPHGDCMTEQLLLCGSVVGEIIFAASL